LSARSAWSDRLESTDWLLWCDRAEPELREDNAERNDIDDPMEPADANEAMLANDPNDATLPTDSTESWEPIDRIEFSDQSDHTVSSVVLVATGRRPRSAGTP
jgi:hypothetical protein